MRCSILLTRDRGRRAGPNPGNSDLRLTGYFFFPGGAAPGFTGAMAYGVAGAATFFACLGFFFSRLLRC